MVMTDPIADMLTRIRNAGAVGHTTVELPHSKLKETVAKVLADEGYLAKVSAQGGVLSLELANENGKPAITGIRRISKPGRRIYLSAKDQPRVRQGLGTAVVTTSQGVMSADTARKRKLGGEVLLEVF